MAHTAATRTTTVMRERFTGPGKAISGPALAQRRAPVPGVASHKRHAWVFFVVHRASGVPRGGRTAAAVLRIIPRRFAQSPCRTAQCLSEWPAPNGSACLREHSMKIAIAPDSFKECLTADEVAGAIEEGVRRALPDCVTVCVPMADGGEGTVDALIAATNGRIVELTGTGPMGTPVATRYGLLGDGESAVIEMAAVSGLPLVRTEERDPRIATTCGTGELLCDALNCGLPHHRAWRQRDQRRRRGRGPGPRRLAPRRSGPRTALGRRRPGAAGND